MAELDPELTHTVTGERVSVRLPDKWRGAPTDTIRQALGGIHVDETASSVVDLVCVAPARGSFAPNLVVTVTSVPAETSPDEWAHSSTRLTSQSIEGYRVIDMVPIGGRPWPRFLSGGAYIADDNALTTMIILEVRPDDSGKYLGITSTLTCRTRDVVGIYPLFEKIIDSLEVDSDGAN